MAKTEFLNPFTQGVTYKEFLEEVEKSKKTIAEYCKGNLEQDQIDWLENDLKQINK